MAKKNLNLAGEDYRYRGQRNVKGKLAIGFEIPSRKAKTYRKLRGLG